ncbi:hypothetical protein CsSME_00023330 [Camellia sinensis var. sinensis]
MADQSAAVDLIPPNPNPTDFDALAIPPLDSAFLSDSFFSDLALPFDADFDDLDFTFDDLYLPFDSEDFLNSFPSQFSFDPSRDASTILQMLMLMLMLKRLEDLQNEINMGKNVNSI